MNQIALCFDGDDVNDDDDDDDNNIIVGSHLMNWFEIARNEFSREKNGEKTLYAIDYLKTFSH